MKLETTVQSLKIHYYSDLNLLDVTHFVQIGGVFSRWLRGPTPAALIPVGVVVMGMNGGLPVPPVNLQLPKYTQPSANTGFANNWRT